MGLRSRFSKCVFCVMLALASIGGAPLRAEDVEELLGTVNQPAIVQTLGDKPTGEELD